jgi:DNA replication and repair protein RecF
MIVRDLSVRNFRNHVATDVSFGPGINALVGENGEGKTNLLEAVSYLGLTKSFAAVHDAAVVRIGTDGFAVGGTVEDGGGRHAVRVVYALETGEKVFSIDGLKLEKLASAVGRFPVVVLAPEHGAITSGAPAERRRFMDLVLSQVSQAYLEDLLEYRRILRQRNRMLAEGRASGRWDEGALEPWTLNLARCGSRIITRRKEFLSEFREYMERAHEQLARTGERPVLTYASAGVGDVPGGENNVVGILLRRLQEGSLEERRRGVTLAGPHRDDLRLSINGKEVQAYASQGQHKSLLVALKVAEFLYVQDRRDESPVVLLDDVFSELDTRRGRHMLDIMGTLGQTLITTTDEEVFRDTVGWNDHHRRFSVVQGTCTRVQAK